MIQKLVWETVKQRPLRTVLSALLIAIPVTLVLTLAGLSKGMIEDATHRYRGAGADIIVRPRTSDFLTLGSATIDQRIVGFIQKQPHVAIATGMVINGSILNTTAGVDLDAISRMSGGIHYLEGGPFQAPNDIIVDDYYAREHKIHLGETIDLHNFQWHVCGIMQAGKLVRTFAELPVLQELTSNSGKVSQIYVKVDDPKNISVVIASLKKLLEGYNIYSMEEFTSLFNYNTIPLLSRFTEVMIGIAILIGFAVVCLSMYMAVLQRTREIGILKSLGASKGYVLSIILTEAILLAAAGTVLGIGLSYGTKWALETFVPASFPPAVDPSWWPIAAVIALAGATLGALYPGLHAASMDPIEALAYE